MTKYGPMIREVLADVTEIDRSAELADDDDLYRAGMTSLETLGILLKLEERFGTRIPDEAIGRHTFATIAAINDLVEQQLGSA